MNKETVKKVYRKTIATTLSVVAGASITLHNPEKSLAQNNEISMTPITTAEDIYNDDHWGQEIVSTYYNLLNSQDKDKYEYIGMPLAEKDISDVDRENKKRNVYYNSDYVPIYIINGDIKAQKNLNKFNYFIGIQAIREEITTKKQYANFTYNINSQILTVTGLDDKLNDNQNLSLNAIILKREVNCEDKGDIFNTTILKQITHGYPLGALGLEISLQKGGVIKRRLDIEKFVSPDEKAMCVIVAFIQDTKTKEIIAASSTDLTPEKTALFNIDHLPKTTLANIEKIANMTTLREANIGMDNKKEYREQIGLRQKVISVTDVQNLRHLDIQLDYTDAEAQIYDVLGAGLSEELQDKAKLTYDPQEHRVTIKFNEPLNGNHDIFSFFIKIKKETINGMDSRQYDTKDVNFKWKTFSAQDSEFNTIKYELREQKNCYPVRMVTDKNKFDLIRNGIIDEQDLDYFISHFGTIKGDRDYRYNCDFYPQNNETGTQGDGRIDGQDLYLLVKEVSEQEALAKKIKEINPDFIYPTIDQSIKTRVLTQICNVLPPLGLGLGENQELTFKAIANQIEDIYKIHGKPIPQDDKSKSLFQRVEEFFNHPTPYAISKKREEEMQG